MSKRMIITVALTTLVLAGFFGTKALQRWFMNYSVNNAPAPTTAVSTSEARTDTWAQSLEAVGTVRAVNGVAVTTQIAGEVKDIAFTSGQIVKKGDVLVQLDNRTDRAQADALQAAAKLATLEFERFERLYNQGSISESELDRKRSERDQAAANADAQRQIVANKTIRAPFDGRLGIRQVDIGQYVKPGDPIVSLGQLDPIYVNFALPEQQISHLDEGLQVAVTVTAHPDREFDGKITVVESGVNANTRNFNIQATLENSDHALRPGMFANVRVQLDAASDVVVVPRTAIAFAPYGNAVYVVKESGEVDDEGNPKLVVKKRFVKLGSVRGDLIAITEGLEPGEKIATSGLLKLRNDAPVYEENDVLPDDNANPTPENS